MNQSKSPFPDVFLVAVRVSPFHLQFRDPFEGQNLETKLEVGQSGSRGSRHNFSQVGFFDELGMTLDSHPTQDGWIPLTQG